MTGPDLARRFAAQPVAIVGDVMLDQFLVGHIDRISPEAPVPVVRIDREEHRLGGAANVANNVRALGGQPRLVGLTGTDEAARTLRETLAAHGIATDGLLADAARPTTRKVRVVTPRHQQVTRLDYESEADVDDAIAAALAGRLRTAAAGASAVVLSDYRKGVVTPAVIAAAAAARGQAPLLVDPKIPIAERYRGCTVITPNHHEAELMTARPIRSADDARDAARVIAGRAESSVVITWGERGLWVLDAAGPAHDEVHLPASAREVADVTGAGDTVIATLALALAAGARLTEAARCANVAAGLVVARFGPAVVTNDELIAALRPVAP